MSQTSTEQSFTPPVDSEFDRPKQSDYFGFTQQEQFFFPDGVSFITIDKMNEGNKARFQKSTGRDLVLERQSGNARMKVDPGGDRHALLIACCKDWNLKRRSQANGELEPIPWSDRNFRDFLAVADPVIIEDLEKAIRKLNPWLMAEMTVEDIDKEIENLQEMRETVEARERGESTSSSK